jgi:chlorophyll synthase
MKIVFVAFLALGAVSGFTTSNVQSSKRASFAPPLSMLPSNKNKMTTSETFFPFEQTTTTDTTTKLNAAPNQEAEDGTGGVRQLLGLKGASGETNIWKIRLQLTKV